MTTVEPVEAMEAASSRTFPDPMSVAASILSRVWICRSAMLAPTLAPSSANSCRDSSGSKDCAGPRLSSNPTRIAFSGAGMLDLRRILMGAHGRSGLCLRRLRGSAVRMAALESYDGRDRMLKNQLLLIVGLQ